MTIEVWMMGVVVALALAVHAFLESRWVEAVDGLTLAGLALSAASWVGFLATGWAP